MASPSLSCEFHSTADLVSAIHTSCEYQISNSSLAKLKQILDPQLGNSIRIFVDWRSRTSKSREPLLPNSWYCFVGSPLRLLEINEDSIFSTLISSRISQSTTARKRWLAKFLFAARQISREQHWWLLFRDIFTGPVSYFLMERLPINAIAVDHTTSNSWTTWLSRIQQAALSGNADNHKMALYISPQISSHPQSYTLDADQLSIALPDRVHVLEVRPNGRIDTLLANRIVTPSSAEPFDIQSYHIIGEKPSIPARLKQSVSLHWLLAESNNTEENSGHCPTSSGIVTQAPIFPLSRWLSHSHKQAGDYLTHCTRAHNSSWPDNHNASQWYQWLLQELPEENSPYATLCKIARSKRLLAHAGLYRGSHAAVSFSEVALPELLARRRYRTHLKRWDWEPYGVLFSKTPLQQIGCKSVIYGDDETWKQLNSKQQPWYQPRHSKDGKESWVEEKEWRMIGDLRFCQLPWESIIFFVPTRREAYELSHFCDWSIGWLYDDNHHLTS
jgi:hypothetical protein